MPIGNLTSQLFANLYLDPLDHFVREELRVRHYLGYMGDFVLLGPDRVARWAWHAAIEMFLRDRLGLALNPRRTGRGPARAAAPRARLRASSRRRPPWAPAERPPAGRRLAVLDREQRAGRVAWATVRSAVGS